MNAHPYLRVALMSTAVLACSTVDTRADILKKANPLNWFKKEETAVPTAAEQQAQEAAAQILLRDAKTAQSTGNNSKAQSIYKDIVTRYRFTNTAATAQFEYATLLRAEDKLKAAYEAFQKFITDYRQSPLFNQAIEQQFLIAEEARAGKKQPTLLLIPMKLDRSELIEFYRGIMRNSPYGKYAAPSQFAIGEIYQDDGDRPNAALAYQSVVENFPNTKLASEAQFRIGAISSAAAARTQDSQNLTATRDALETYRLAHPRGERLSEAETLLGKNTEALSIKAFEVGKFYETTGKPAAAAIYYNEVISLGDPNYAAKARERLSGLAAAHPEEMKNTPAMKEDNFIVPAAVKTKDLDDYAGPPAPVIAQMNRQSEMRVEDDNFKPIPLQEPDLPTRPVDQPPPGMLLPPAAGELPVLPPLPPAPGMAAPELPVVPPSPDSLPVPPPAGVMPPAAAPTPAPAPAETKTEEEKPAEEDKPAPVSLPATPDKQTDKALIDPAPAVTPAAPTPPN